MSAISHAKYGFLAERNLYYQNDGKKAPQKDFSTVSYHLVNYIGGHTHLTSTLRGGWMEGVN